MKSDKVAQLDQLLGTASAARDHEKQRQRERLIEERRHLHTFRQLTDRVIRPTVREFMQRLESGGHLTRLRSMAENRIRFDVLLESGSRVAGLLEIELVEGSRGQIRTKALRNLGSMFEDTTPIAEFDADVLGDLLLRFVRELTSLPPR